MSTNPTFPEYGERIAMIKITNVEVFGWRGAILGMRNSYSSRDKSDSFSGGSFIGFGPKDLALATKLAKAGGSEAKFRRMIHVQADVTAPLYWWKQFDTYKVGTVALSESTMHTIMVKEFSIDDFSHADSGIISPAAGLQLISMVNTLNELRRLYLEEENRTFEKMYWNDIIQLLPESYNQMRTIDLNYEVLSHIVKDRLGHRLKEWQDFCITMLHECVYSKELIFELNEVNNDSDKRKEDRSD